MRIITKTEELLDSYVEAKDRAEQATHQLKLAEQALIEEMEAKQRKSVSKTEGDKKIQATYIKAERSSVNEDSLKKALGAARFKKYTKQVVDKAKLEAAMQTGELDPMQVGQHVTVSYTKPFLRLTIGKADD